MKVKVSSLKHHPKNKEIYDLSSIDELMESISEVGLLQPLTIDTRNQVISGNRRFESIKRLGWNEVLVLYDRINYVDIYFLSKMGTVFRTRSLGNITSYGVSLGFNL